MLSEETHALQLWLQAYEPAVNVDVSSNEIVMRSTRHSRAGVVACARRATDLTSDLDAALARLVLQMS